MTTHKLEVFISNNSDDPVTINDKTLMFTISLPLTGTLASGDHSGEGSKFLYDVSQAPAAKFKIRIRYSVALGNTFDENHINVQVDKLVLRAYYTPAES